MIHFLGVSTGVPSIFWITNRFNSKNTPIIINFRLQGKSRTHFDISFALFRIFPPRTHSTSDHFERDAILNPLNIELVENFDKNGLGFVNDNLLELDLLILLIFGGIKIVVANQAAENFAQNFLSLSRKGVSLAISKFNI